MTDERRIGAALTRALDVHGPQVDKGGEPYMKHPLRVAQTFERGSDLYIAALLHDVVEDGDTTTSDIEQEFGHSVATLVDAVTRRPGESYGEFIARVCRSGHDARALKLADIADNLLPSRRANIPDSLVARYTAAQARLVNPNP